MSWGFYGRVEELKLLDAILARQRWFFVKITGRRRIGKTTLIQQALQAAHGRKACYVQIPDSAPAGVLSAVSDAMDTFQIDRQQFPPPASLLELARTIGTLATAGYVVALDEFQYFNRERLKEFCSHLQTVVDDLNARSADIRGGLLVLGSVHTEIQALLEDRSAPLYNRTTDDLTLSHLDIQSLVALLTAHADPTPERLLFLWSLFEGVPKFYRDCYEQEVLSKGRRDVLERAFFLSSSPLRTEADNWFLKELHGRYDVVLKYVARKAGCTHGELVEHVRQMSPQSGEQVGGYLKILIERYRLIERRVPIFSDAKVKRGRYYLTDNFLRSWLAALAGTVTAMNFVPVDRLIGQADERLAEVEGGAFEKLVGVLYEERSRKGIGDFSLSSRLQGYWDRGDTEIDLVALNENDRLVRFGSCKRNPERLIADLPAFNGHVDRFLAAFPRFSDWRIERVGLAPRLPIEVRTKLSAAGHLSQDLVDLTADFV